VNSILGVPGLKEHNGIKNRQETLVLLKQEARSLMIPLLVAEPRERSVEALPLKRDHQDPFRGRNRQHLVSGLNKPSSILNQIPSPISDRHDYLRTDDYLRRTLVMRSFGSLGLLGNVQTIPPFSKRILLELSRWSRTQFTV